MNKYFIKSGFVLIQLLLITSVATAQYDGSFEGIYFNRSVSAQSSALGKISTTLSNNAFSIHSNSALLSFQKGYLAGYSTSTPYYSLKNGRFNSYAVGGKIINDISVGISHHDFDSGLESSEQLTTLGIAFRTTENLSLGINLQRFNIDLDRKDETGNFIGTYSSQEYYFNLTSAYILPINLSFADETSLTLGFTYDNVFQQSIDLESWFTRSKIELPSIITIGANNKLFWKQLSDFFLVKNISLNLLSEYQNVINYKYKTRFSLGSELGLNNFIKLRIGYYIQSTEVFFDGPTNKSSISDLTYGVGANIPLSKFVLSIDFTMMQQHLYTTINPQNIGKFSSLSASVNVNI